MLGHPEQRSSEIFHPKQTIAPIPMQKILIIIHAPPYGSERCLSGLRLATALAGRDDKPEVRTS